MLVDDLVAGDYSAVRGDVRIGRLTEEELTRAIAAYGRRLVPLPRGAMDAMDVYPLDSLPGQFAVDVPLWTIEEGRSDLTLSLKVIDRDDFVMVSINDLHVL
jgi:hypothetical protein